MSESRSDHEEDEGTGAQGPNLKLIYVLIGVAMLVAMGLAAWIILPFYQRR
jgi:hypothetical protein